MAEAEERRWGKPASGRSAVMAVAILLLAFTVVIAGYQIRTMQQSVFVSEKRK